MFNPVQLFRSLLLPLGVRQGDSKAMVRTLRAEHSWCKVRTLLYSDLLTAGTQQKQGTCICASLSIVRKGSTTSLSTEWFLGLKCLDVYYSRNSSSTKRWEFHAHQSMSLQKVRAGKTAWWGKRLWWRKSEGLHLTPELTEELGTEVNVGNPRMEESEAGWALGLTDQPVYQTGKFQVKLGDLVLKNKR